MQENLSEAGAVLQNPLGSIPPGPLSVGRGLAASSQEPHHAHPCSSLSDLGFQSSLLTVMERLAYTTV